MTNNEQLKGGEQSQELTEAEKVLSSMPDFNEHIADVNKEDNKENGSYLVNAAIESISDRLSLNKDELESALLGDGPQGIINEAQDIIKDNYDCVEEISDLNYKELERSRDLFVFDVLSDMHDKWCNKHSDEFFDRKQFNDRYKFLDFSLIGAGNAYYYFELAEPILKKLGIEEDSEDHDLFDSYYDIPQKKEDDWRLRDEYSMEEEEETHEYRYREGEDPLEDERLKAWKTEYPEDYEKNVRRYDHLNEEDALERYQKEEDADDDPFEYDDRPLLVITEPITYELGRGCYFAEDLHKNPSKYLSKGASEKIAEAIKNSFNTAAEITMQVGEQGSGDEEADWGCLWAYHNRGGKGVYDYWNQNYDPFATNDDYFNSQEYINDGWN